MRHVVKDKQAFWNADSNRAKLASRPGSEQKRRVRQKILMFGLPLAVALLWLMLTWEPVDRHVVESVSEEAPADEERQPTPPQPPEVSVTTARPAAIPAAAPPAAAPEPEEEPEEPEDTPSSIKLVHIDPQQQDPNELTPPAASGPYKELQTIFESAARDANSSAMESTIESAFKAPEVPEGLLESVVCQGEVCRMRTRWTPKRAGGFMHAMMGLGSMHLDEDEKTLLFERNYGFGEASERNTNGERYIDVYVHKKITDPNVPKIRH